MLKRTPRASGNPADTAGFKGRLDQRANKRTAVATYARTMPVTTPWKVWAYQSLQPSMLKRTPRASVNHADTAGFKGPSRSTRQQTHRRRDLCPNHAGAHTLKGVGISAPSAEHAKTHPARIGQPRRHRRF